MSAIVGRPLPVHAFDQVPVVYQVIERVDGAAG